jgi:hypothetical protein
MNIEILKVAWAAFKTVWRVMRANEQKHPGNEWQRISKREHLQHISDHINNIDNPGEDHAGNALTRLAMIKSRW